MSSAPKLILRQVQNILSAYLYDQPATTSGHRNIKRPLDLFLRTYFNSHKHLGSSERSNISDKVYNMVRYEYLLSHLVKCKPYDHENPPKYTESLAKQIEYKSNMLLSSDFYTAMDNPNLPKHLRVSQNKTLFKELSLSLAKPGNILNGLTEGSKSKHKIAESLGDEDSAFEVSKIMNSRAPLTLRFNPIKAPSHQIVEALEKKHKLRLLKCEWAPYGFKLVSSKNINLLETEEFDKGFFEIQDEGSQITALRADAKPGDLVLDFCGGSGGKTLAIAHLLQGKGQIFVHEPREVALGKAKRRFARAGIQNVQFHSDESKLSKAAAGKMNWVIVDAPCTGTGTLRRNPDLKLKFTEDWIKRNVLLQREIISKAVKYMRPDGKMLYITCSLLKQENEDQVKEVCSRHNLTLENQEVMRITPQKDGTDGFFAAVLVRRKR